MMKVLIADDEARVCQLIQNLMDWDALDMTVIGIAHNGIEALDIIRTGAPDLVITDIRMPGCDGLDLISRAKLLDPKIEFIIISGYRHFEYAQSAIKYGVSDYLLKPIKKDELRETLEKMRRKYRLKTEQMSKDELIKIRMENDTKRLRMKFFTDSILGSQPISADPYALNEHYHFSFSPGFFIGFIIKIDSENNEMGDAEIQVLSNKVSDIMQKVRDKCFDCALFVSESRIYGVINCAQTQMQEIDRAFRIAMEMLIAQKAAFANINFTVCIGSEQDSPDRLKQSVEEAVTAMGERLTTFGGRIIRFEPEMRGNGCDDKALADLNRAMTAAVEVFDSAKLQAAISAFCERISANSCGGAKIFDSVVEAYHRYLILLQNLQMLSDDVAKRFAAFRKGADLCADKNQLFRYFARQAAALIENLAENRENEESRPIRIAKEYIHSNYMNPVTLEQVSGIVGFNASYFSTFFKKKCGVGFLEYLSEVRMNKAKELLRETGKSVAEICETVGYTDIKHFTATFKKATGIKPTEFRKLYS